MQRKMICWALAWLLTLGTVSQCRSQQPGGLVRADALLWVQRIDTRRLRSAEFSVISKELSSDDEQRIYVALLELQHRGVAGRAARGRVAQLLADHDEPAIRATAADTLPRIDASQPTLAALRTAISDKGVRRDFPPVWMAAARSLGRHFPSESKAQGMEMLGGSERLSRIAGSVLIGAMAHPPREAVDDLVAMAKASDDQLRLYGVRALGAAGEHAEIVTPVLQDLVGHADFHTGYFACQALAKIGPPAKAALPSLYRAMKEGPVSVRRHAALAIGQIADKEPEAIEALAGALSDPLEPVRRDALTALAELGPRARAALPSIQKVMTAKRFHPRSYAALALYRITGEKEAPRKVLVEELQGQLAPEAIEVLKMMGVELNLVGDIRGLLKHEQSTVRYFAIEALGALGGAAADAVPDLTKLTDPANEADADVRAAASESLELIRSAPKVTGQSGGVS